MAKQHWISEEAAMSRMGYKDKKYFRALVKNGTLDISYRANPSGRNYQYDEKGIERLLDKNAVLIHS